MAARRKVFVCKSHDGVWLAGCSVVVAHSRGEAYEMLDAELIREGLQPSFLQSYELEEIKGCKAAILFNGDY